MDESDPSKYNATYDQKGKPTLDAPNVTFTQSEKLANALAIVHQKWSAPTWARLLFVEDPHVDADHDEKFPDQIPVIMELFASKSEAAAAGKAELDARGDSAGSDNNVVAIPDGWRTDQWEDELADVREVVKGLSASRAIRNRVEKYITENYGNEEEFSATADQVIASL